MNKLNKTSKRFDLELNNEPLKKISINAILQLSINLNQVHRFTPY